MLNAVVVLALLGLTIGLVLGVAAQRLKVEENPVARGIERLLPGSQCGQCGFAGCGPAAQAIADGSAPITACPPGGNSLVAKIAALMGVVLDADAMGWDERRAAIVGEELCIGCTKCFRVCPTDAIVGAPKQIHSVLRDYCTACGLCVDACPTETMHLVPVSESLDSWQWPKPCTEAA